MEVPSRLILITLARVNEVARMKAHQCGRRKEGERRHTGGIGEASPALDGF